MFNCIVIYPNKFNYSHCFKIHYLPKNVPIVPTMLRPIAPPDNESKLALRAHAHALVPRKCVLKLELTSKLNVSPKALIYIH